MLWLLAFFCTFRMVFPATFENRHSMRDYAIEDQSTYIRPATHTFSNRTQCMELCELPCTITIVYMGSQQLEMFNCAKLRPPKVSMLGSIKGNSFYMTLLVLGCIVAGVVALLTLCFCCTYCCRPTVSSRGSSTNPLTQEDQKDSIHPLNIDKNGEFREYLPPRKERERSRYGHAAAQNV